MLKPLKVRAADDKEEGNASVQSVGVVRGVGFCKNGTGGGKEKEIPADFLLGAYNYSTAHGFMLRSQLDCIYGKLVC